MLKSSLLFILLFTVSCAKNTLPYFPGIENFHVTVIPNMVLSDEFVSQVVNPESISMNRSPAVRCLYFRVVSKRPFELRYVADMPGYYCHQIGGFNREDNIILFQWISKISDWAESLKDKCFK